MAYKLKSPADLPQRTPYQLVLFLFGILVGAWTLLRVMLLVRFSPAPLLTVESGELLLLGFQRDALAALVLLVPVLGWFFVVPQRWYVERWQRFFFWLIATTVAVVHATLLTAEYFYFTEFARRLDAAALYLALHPEQGKLLVPPFVGWWLAGTVALAWLVVVIAKRRYSSMWLSTSSPWRRIGWLTFGVGLVFGLGYLLERYALPEPRHQPQQEIARNGLLTLAKAAWDYRAAGDSPERLVFPRVFDPEELPPDPPLGVTGTIEKHDAFPSKHVAPRNVHVWLPPSYASEPERRYPVIYANDGQNMFDPVLSFAGVDWALDETMTRLAAEGKAREAIIVAVWNTPQRLKEYVPQKAVLAALGTWREPAMRKLGKDSSIRIEDHGWRLSAAYLQFLASELKPFVDTRYRTLTNRADTFILGASAGGMISFYAVSELPDVFGGAACFSTHLPLADGALVEYFRAKLPDPATHRLYFDFGTAAVDANETPFHLKLDAALAARGYAAGTNWITARFNAADHSEKAWRRRAHLALEFLLGNSPP
jgi:predicted alpha/beta superfamily hydrolase